MGAVLTRRSALELIDRHRLRIRKSLGQHFVVDPNTVRRISRLAGVGPGDSVVEVGAGLGSLTLALAETGAAVTAVEVDPALIPALEETVAGTGVRVVQADAMTADWEALLAGALRWHLVANLPYNVATPLVLDLLAGVPAITDMLVMVQREAGERLAASPGQPAYGIPSVRVAYHATAQVVGRVGPSVFLPPPRVESVLVRLVRRPAPAVASDPDVLFGLVRAGFGQRRKMLRRSLAALAGSPDFAAAGVAPEARAEDLAVEDWGRLADVVAARAR